jgi:hypothetical protein
MNDQRAFQPKLAIDISIVMLGLILLSLAFTSPMSIDSTGRNHGNIWLGFYIVLDGICFLLSYFYAQHSYIFRLLDWVCKNFSRPKGRKMAFFYFGLASCIGVAVILGNI